MVYFLIILFCIGGISSVSECIYILLRYIKNTSSTKFYIKEENSFIESEDKNDNR